MVVQLGNHPSELSLFRQSPQRRRHPAQLRYRRVFVQLAMFGSRGFLAINLTNRGALN